MRQFWRWTSSLDIGYVKKYSVSRVKHWSWRSSLVVVPHYILLHLLNCRLGLFNHCFHSFCKLIYCFQSGGLLPRFKAHIRSASSVEQEQSLLGRYMYMIVVLELCHGQQIVPIVLPLIDKELQVLIQFLVDVLHLSISLWMPSSEGSQLHSQQLVEFPGEEYHKLGSMV